MIEPRNAGVAEALVVTDSLMTQEAIIRPRRWMETLGTVGRLGSIVGS